MGRSEARLLRCLPPVQREAHLQRDVDEISVRLSEANVKNYTMSRIYSLLAKSVGVRIKYKDLVAT